MNPLALLFPGICILCRRRSNRDIGLCRECEQAFETNRRACSMCAEPMPAKGESSSGAVCGSCLVAPPPWTLAVAPFAYAPPLASVIEGLKSGNGLLQARILGNLLASFVAARYTHRPLPEALLAMPLARRRQRQRGFNQAELLAGVVGRALALPRLKGRLVRIRDAPPQRSLPRSARLRNVRGAFAMSRAIPAGRVALVDDVTTTGATVRAATEALRAAGVEEVHVWVAAKTSSAGAGFGSSR